MKPIKARCPTCGRNPNTSSRSPYRRPRLFADRRDLAVARSEIIKRLGYEERASGVEAKILDAIGRFLEDLWNDPAPWMYEDEDGEAA